MAGERRIHFVDRVLVALAIGALGFLAWRVSDVFVLAFGGILLATLLRTLSDALARCTPLPTHWALGMVVLLIVGAAGTLFWLVGERVENQLSQLWAALPGALAKAKIWLESSPLGQAIVDGASAFGRNTQPLSGIAGFATTTFGALADVLVMLFLGLYLAADPGLYRRGLLKLIPPRHRRRVAEALRAAGQGLQKWLLGQFVAMVTIGLMSGIGLAALDVPLALSLGILAGLLEFIPYIGPILSSIPAILLAFTQGPQQALFVTLFFLAIHQIEGNVVMPVVQRWAVSLPPALGIIAVAMFGVLFGLLGVLFATPLMVVAMILVEKLYVEDALGESDQT